MINFEALDDLTPEKIANLCMIDFEHLENTLQTHAALYAFVEARYEEVEYDRTSAMVYLERAKAVAFNEIQEREPGLAIGKTNVLIEVDPKVIKVKDMVLSASQRLGAYKALVKGLQHRKDMLIQISSRQKAEARQI